MVAVFDIGLAIAPPDVVNVAQLECVTWFFPHWGLRMDQKSKKNPIKTREINEVNVQEETITDKKGVNLLYIKALLAVPDH
jgi:hypothetical protein